MFQSRNGDNQPQQSQNVEQKSRVKSVLRYTMMPEIIPRIRAIGLHFGHFAYLLALVFASARLIPSTHPVLNAVNIGRYTVRQVIALAANNITWSWKNIDQVAIFSAIIIGIIMIVIQAVLIAVAALIGVEPASAASASSFFSPSGDGYRAADDPMMIFFAQVFGNLNDFWGAGVGANAPGSSTGIHQGLYAMLSLYSMAMMVIAVIIVLYYIMTVVGEAAKTGTPFGNRFNSLWAPIRLVIALGLLVPLGSGLNSAQYMTLWIAKMGSGLGTQVWNQMLPAFASKKSDDYVLGEFQNEWVNEAAVNIFFMKTCMHAHNKNIGVPAGDGRLIKENIDFVDSKKKILISYDNGDLSDRLYSGVFGLRFVYPKISCGKMEIDLQAVDSASSVTARIVPIDKIYAISKNIFTALMSSAQASEISELAKKHAENNTSINGYAQNTEALRQILDKVVKHADGIRVANSLNIASEFKTEFDGKIAEYIKNRGNSWIYAGTWYLEISRLIEATKNTQKRAVPNMVEGLVTSSQSMTWEGVDFVLWGEAGWGWFPTTISADDAAKYYTLDIDGVNSEVVNLIQSGYVFYNEYRLEIINGEKIPKPCREDTISGGLSKIACTIVSMLVPEHLIILAENNDLRIGQDGEKIEPAPGTTFRTMDPMAALMNAGHTIVYRSWFIMAVGLGANVIGGIAKIIPGKLGKIIGSIVGGIGSVAILIGALGLTAGLVLFFLLPILPFIYFFFAIVSWVMEIFEAVVAMPLWALAHLSIDGEGMPGQAAMSGYYLLLSILLRPALIVIGLVAGALIFGASIFLLQELFSIAVFVKDAGTTSGLEWLIYTLIFAYLSYSAGITSFKLVDNIPNQILRWIGSSTPTFSEGKEDPVGGNQQLLAAAGGFVGSQLAGGLGGAASGIGESMGAKSRKQENADIETQGMQSANTKADFERNKTGGRNTDGGGDKPKDTSPLRDPRDD